MATLRELKKRLSGVRTTLQLAGAMKTVASAKLARLNALSAAYGKYAGYCEKLSVFSSFGNTPSPDAPEESRMYILLCGNRGLCGGYNSELFAYLSEETRICPIPYRIAVCGKAGISHFREKNIPRIAEFVFGDIPAAEDSGRLADFICDMWSSGKATEVFFVYQHTVNALTRHPELKRILPSSGNEAGEHEMLFVPDRQTAEDEIQMLCFRNMIHSLVLECAAGVQAATLIAMRSAYDNAEATAAMLETTINRKRQAEVTSGVLETSPGGNENAT